VSFWINVILQETTDKPNHKHTFWHEKACKHTDTHLRHGHFPDQSGLASYPWIIRGDLCQKNFPILTTRISHWISLIFQSLRYSGWKECISISISCSPAIQKRKPTIMNRPEMCSWPLRVPSCRRLLQRQVENVFVDGCQGDAVCLGKHCIGTILR